MTHFTKIFLLLISAPVLCYYKEAVTFLFDRYRSILGGETRIIVLRIGSVRECLRLEII